MKDKKKKGNTSAIIISIVISIAVLGIVGYLVVNTTSESDIYIQDNRLYIDGMYSMTADIDNFQSISLEEIPKITRKVNGADFRDIRKGVFNVESLGSCNIYLHNSKSQCIIIVRDEGARPILINLYEDADTQKLFDELITYLD